jgi:hypothetical protein
MQKGEDRTMEVRSTEDGILRAFSLLLQQQSKPRGKQKFHYQPAGSAVHAARSLNKAEAAAIDSIVDQLKALDPKAEENAETVKSLLKELSKQPVRFVPVKRQQRIDYSKTYPYGSKRQGY